jgi:hypothetical protein
MKSPYSETYVVSAQEFEAIAKERFNGDRKYLASLILPYFRHRSWKRLWLVSDDPADARDDDEEPLAL